MFVNVPLMIIELAQFLYVMEYGINPQYWMGQPGVSFKEIIFYVLKLFFYVLQ